MSNAPEPWAGYPDYRPGVGEQQQPPRTAADASRALWSTVAVLGFVAVGVGFAAPIPLEYAVRLPAAAAVVAAVGLLPRQPAHGWLVVSLAAVGFLDALTQVVAGSTAGWPLVVVLVVDGLQALIAVGALLVAARRRDDADDGTVAHGIADADADEPGRRYAAGYPEARQSGGPGGARVRAPRAAGALADAAQGSYAAMQGAPAQHYQRAPAMPPGSRASASDATDPGLPGAQFGTSAASPSTRPAGPRGENPPR